VSIFVTWIGEGAEPRGLIAEATRVLGREYGRPAARLLLDGRPMDSYDATRRQHSSSAMLGWLAERVALAALTTVDHRRHAHADPRVHARPEAGHHGSRRLLGVTDVDLFIPVLTFVFGEAQLGRQAAVVSIARLREGSAPALVTARLAKEAVHEVGHTFGLVHCASDACAMARSPGLAAVDRKSDRLCADCRIRYEEFREHPYVAPHTPHPGR
jgi:archaemetzincin